MQTRPSDRLAALRGRQYIRLTPYRKSGAAAPTPVWFAIGRVFVEIQPADA